MKNKQAQQCLLAKVLGAAPITSASLASMHETPKSYLLHQVVIERSDSTAGPRATDRKAECPIDSRDHRPRSEPLRSKIPREIVKPSRLRRRTCNRSVPAMQWRDNLS
jgi:hypothetical protein